MSFEMNAIQILNIVILFVQTSLAVVILTKGYKIHNTLFFNAIGMLVMNFGLVYMMTVRTITDSFVQTIIYYCSFIIILIHYERYLHEKTWQPSVIAAVFILVVKLTILYSYVFWASTQDPTTLLTSSDANASEMYRIVWINRLDFSNIKDFFIFSQIVTTRVPVFFMALRMLYIIQTIHYRHNIQGTLWDRNGILMIFIFSFFGLPFIPALFSFGQIFAISGLFILLINNLKHPDYAFKIPTSIVSIIIYNEYGILVYARRFMYVQKDTSENETLMSGYLLGISQLINDTLGEQVKLYRVDAEPFKIEFYSFVTSKTTCAIISYGLVPFLQRSFKLLEKNLTDEIKTKINSPIVNKSELQPQIDANIKKVFPFLDFK
jgi:hypothetical protein